MLIDLRTLPPEERRYEYTLEKSWWEPDDGPVLGFDSPLQVEISIYKAGERFVLRGKISGRLRIRCDRCLRAFTRKIETNFELYLKLPVPLEPDGAEVELEDEDMDLDFLTGEEIDIDRIIKEQIYLLLPIRNLCREGCRGLCPVCGADLNVEECRCAQDRGHPAFQMLRGLKAATEGGLKSKDQRKRS